MSVYRRPSVFFFFNDTATTEIYTLSLHDALPISGLEHGCSLEARNHAHTVVVRDHHVTGIHEATSANHRNIHRSQGLLYGSLRVHGPGPDREAHAGQITDVPDTGIDDQTAEPVRGERACKQLAEIAGV